MQSIAASCSSASSSRTWAAARRSPAPPSRPSSRHVAFLCSQSSSSYPSSSHGCRWPVAGAPKLPLDIRGALRPLPSPLLAPGVAAVRTRAAAATASPPAAGMPEGGGGISRTLQLGTMILVWYLLNIYFNIYNKLVRRFVPFFRSFPNGVVQPYRTF